MAVFSDSLIMDLLVTTITLFALIYWYLTNNFDYWQKRQVPFVKPVPFFGNFKERLSFRKPTYLAVQDLYNEMNHHKLFGVWRIKKPMLIVRDPEIIKQILVKDFVYFHDRGMIIDEKSNPLSLNLFNLEGAKWRSLRAKLSPTFTSGKMKMMFALMKECAQEFGDLVSEEAQTKDEIEFKELFANMTTDIIGTCAFGLQCNSMKDPNSEFRTMGRKIFKPSITTTLGLMVAHMFPVIGKMFKFVFPPTEVCDFFLKEVKDIVNYREKTNVKRNDFLQLLIQLKNKGHVEDEDGELKLLSDTDIFGNGDIKDIEFTDNLLASQAFVFFLAGFETSSTAMSFALHELTINPDIQAKLVDEIDRVLAESDGELTYDALQRMEYLDNVVNESLRKYPPVGMLLRVCRKTYQEPVTGAVIDKGTNVHIPTYSLHHDPKYYPDPERFDPDRFTEKEKAKRPHYAFLPFGEGPRICIGLRFGRLQAKLGLAALLSRFKLSTCDRTQHPLTMDPVALITACKGGVWAHVTPREPTNSAVATSPSEATAR